MSGDTSYAPRKGPPVWLDLDQDALDDAYDQAVYAFNARNIAERLRRRNEHALAVIGKPNGSPTAPTQIEKIDIYRTRRPTAPTMVFIYGGAWLGGRSANFALYAEAFVKAGANFVAVDFNNVIETGGDLFPMVDQCRRAVAFMYRNAAQLWRGPEPATYLCAAARRQPFGRMCRHHPMGEARGCPATSSKAPCSAAASTTSSRSASPKGQLRQVHRRNGRGAVAAIRPSTTSIPLWC